MKRSHERGSKTLHQKNELSKVSKKWPCWMKSSYKVLPCMGGKNHFWRSIVKPRPFVFFPSSDLYSKSMSFFSSANSQYFFMKILGIGSWVSWINSCKGHWCGSTYMVVRLSDVRGNFFVFLSLFWAYVEQHDNHMRNIFFLLSFPQNERKIY